MIDQEVVRLQITMNDTGRMKILQAHDDLSDVVTGPFFGEVTEGLNQSGTIAAVEILHDEIEMVSRAESIEELDNKVRVSLVHEDLAPRIQVDEAEKVFECGFVGSREDGASEVGCRYQSTSEMSKFPSP